MKKTFAIAIICCVLPIVIIGFLVSRGNQKAPSISDQQIKKTDAGEVAIGKAFPAFSVIDVDGASITNETLKGKPTVLWFTTTWCTPCQIGAQKVAEFNKELGNSLNVLVFFVDPRESENDLRKWRDSYASPDWKLAFNNGLAEKIGIKFLDSKYLLDKDGVILDFNTQIVNDQYLNLLRSATKVNQ